MNAVHEKGEAAESGSGESIESGLNIPESRCWWSSITKGLFPMEWKTATKKDLKGPLVKFG